MIQDKWMDEQVKGEHQVFTLPDKAGKGCLELEANWNTSTAIGCGMLKLTVVKNGKRDTVVIERKYLDSILFLVASEAERSKRVQAHFREYETKKVRMVVEATHDIKKGDPLVVYRDERVPVDHEYTRN